MKTKPLDTIVKTSHGDATVKSVIENDLPYWHAAAVNAASMIEFYKKLISEPEQASART